MDRDWLTRPATIRGLWIAFIAALAGTIGAELLVEHHAAFAIDGVFGFDALYGFASCVALVLFSKLLGAVLKRPDDSYD